MSAKFQVWKLYVMGNIETAQKKNYPSGTDITVMFKKRAAVFYRGLKTRGVAECF